MLFNIRKNGRLYVRCIPCFSGQLDVQKLAKNNKIPAISQESGTRFRQEIVVDHFSSKSHIEAVKIHRISSLPPLQAAKVGPIVKYSTKIFKEYQTKIGS